MPDFIIKKEQAGNNQRIHAAYHRSSDIQLPRKSLHLKYDKNNLKLKVHDLENPCD